MDVRREIAAQLELYQMLIKVEDQEVTSKERTTLNDEVLVVDEMEVKASVKSFTL